MQPLRLVQITDTHLFGDPSEDLRGVLSLPTLNAVLGRAAADIARADAVLVTGDIVQDDPTGYARFREAMLPLGKPVLCIPGNHDLPSVLRRELARPPFVVGGHVDLQAWRIVLLDSVLQGAASGRLSPAELQSLDQALGSEPERHALVCLHHHPVSMSSQWLDQVGLENCDDFFAVIDRHPQVRAIVWGHVHQSAELERHGVRLLSTPSTCAQFKPRAARFELDHRPPGYRILELHADGSLRTEVLWLDSAGAQAASRSAFSCSAA